MKTNYLFFHFSSHPFEASKFDTQSSFANSQAFSLSCKPFVGIF